MKKKTPVPNPIRHKTTLTPKNTAAGLTLLLLFSFNSENKKNKKNLFVYFENDWKLHLFMSKKAFL